MQVNSICIDKCSRTAVVFTDVVAACEAPHRPRPPLLHACCVRFSGSGRQRCMRVCAKHTPRPIGPGRPHTQVVNSTSVEVQAKGVVPTVSVDNTSGVQIYLSREACSAAITTAKSSEVNVLIPGATDADDMCAGLSQVPVLCSCP